MSRSSSRDSYGYRPGRVAQDALAVIRTRCWTQDWVLDLDIRAFFDSVPHDLVLKAVAHHTGERWVLLYIATVAESPHADAGRDARGQGERHPAGVTDHAPNAIDNFCFDVTLSYRRLERPRRVPARK